MSLSPITTEDAARAQVDEVFDKLSASRNGLDESEAAERLRKYGPNEIAEKKANPVLKFLSYFWGPIPWMIEAAAAMSAVVQRWEDLTIILVLLLMNGVVGFWREYQAGNTIESLKQRLAPKARVLRSQKWLQIQAKGLVPGDIVRVRLGDIVPADLKLIEGEYLLVDQSALTGESLPVEKHSADIAYSGSVIRQGEMDELCRHHGK